MKLYFEFVRGEGLLAYNNELGIHINSISRILIKTTAAGKTVMCRVFCVQDMDGKALDVDVDKIPNRRKKTDELAYLLMRSSLDRELILSAEVLGEQFVGPEFSLKRFSSHGELEAVQVPYICVKAKLLDVKCEQWETVPLTGWDDSIGPFFWEYKEAMAPMISARTEKEFEQGVAVARAAFQLWKRRLDAVENYTLEDYLAGKPVFPDELLRKAENNSNQ